MFRPIRYRTRELEILKGLFHHRYRMHDMLPRVRSPGGCRPTSEGRKVCLVFPDPFVLYLEFFRFANVDYVTVLSTRHNPEPKKIASYDVMCQYWINLLKRLHEFPLEHAERLIQEIIAFVVPKFHLAAHRLKCRVEFSLNYEPGAGRRDMEGPERTWFGLQGGGSTKDQGPGFWSDAMDDKFSHWNWSKLVRLGTCPPFTAFGL